MKNMLRKMVITLAVGALTLPALVLADSTGGTKTDQDLSRKVRHELVMLPYFSIFDNLEYKVDGNTVTLMGEVTRPVLKLDAQRAVQRVEGVHQVVNKIEVLPLSPFDNRIRMAEYHAIFGYASMYRYAMGTMPSIRIIVNNGNVTLEGFVNNQMDKNIAGIRANGVSGVFHVTNNLVVAKS